MCYEIEIVPRDVMFFRDGHPLGGSADGNGAYWPLPSVFHSSIRASLVRRFGPVIDSWESRHRPTEREKDRQKDKTTRFNFGGLKTWGPFPKDAEGHIYVPTPADLLPADMGNLSGGVMQPLKGEGLNGQSNLPSPLQYIVGSRGKPDKKTVNPWIRAGELQKYLEGTVQGLETIPASELYSAEARPGIEISAASRSIVEKQFYSAEYLRLERYVSMVAFVECEAHRRGMASGTDIMKELFAATRHDHLIFGGQRGVAWMENCRRKTTMTPLNLAGNESSPSTRVKWVLLSPALFANGWLPGLIDKETGKVRLKEKIARGDLPRGKWREMIHASGYIGAKLVAARIPKPLLASGWKLDLQADDAGGQTKSTRKYVAPGAVYYFECDNVAEAQKLRKALHGQTQSDALGEQGFGLGVCGDWDFITL